MEARVNKGEHAKTYNSHKERLYTLRKKHNAMGTKDFHGLSFSLDQLQAWYRVNH